jgi:glutathione S-transferase
MWMDWQATELNAAWRYAFMARVRRDPAFADPAQVEASARRWNALIGLLNDHLSTGRAYVTGNVFTLADVVLGLSAHRWQMTPIDHVPAPAVGAWLNRLRARPAAAASLAADLP